MSYRVVRRTIQPAVHPQILFLNHNPRMRHEEEYWYRVGKELKQVVTFVPEVFIASVEYECCKKILATLAGVLLGAPMLKRALPRLTMSCESDRVFQHSDDSLALEYDTEEIQFLAQFCGGKQDTQFRALLDTLARHPGFSILLCCHITGAFLRHPKSHGVYEEAEVWRSAPPLQPEDTILIEHFAFLGRGKIPSYLVYGVASAAGE